MNITVTLHTLIIKDKSNGETFSVKTVRSAREVAGYLEETENEAIHNALEDTIAQARQ